MKKGSMPQKAAKYSCSNEVDWGQFSPYVLLLKMILSHSLFSSLQFHRSLVLTFCFQLLKIIFRNFLKLIVGWNFKIQEVGFSLYIGLTDEDQKGRLFWPYRLAETINLEQFPKFEINFKYDTTKNFYRWIPLSKKYRKPLSF